MTNAARNLRLVSAVQRPPLLPAGPVERTMLVPLWARAAEMRKRRPMVSDARALEICENIDFDFAPFRHAYGTQMGCVLRGMFYDQWVSSFLGVHPYGTVVELGAGLSTRFERIDNGRARWVDLDLPDAMAFRQRYFSPSPRRVYLAASVLEQDWPKTIKGCAPGPYCFVSEGMLMYLKPEEVHALFVRIADSFAPSEIVFDSIAPVVVRHQRFHDSMRHMMDAPFRWGIEDVREIQHWDPRITVCEVATLSDIARGFGHRVSRAHRLIGAVLERILPKVAGAYRMSRVAFARSSDVSRAWSGPGGAVDVADLR